MARHLLYMLLLACVSMVHTPCLYAQQGGETIAPIEDFRELRNKPLPSGYTVRYFKDIHGVFAPFLGHWRSHRGNQRYDLWILKQERCRFESDIIRDELYAHYEVVDTVLNRPIATSMYLENLAEGLFFSFPDGDGEEGVSGLSYLMFEGKSRYEFLYRGRKKGERGIWKLTYSGDPQSLEFSYGLMQEFMHTFRYVDPSIPQTFPLRPELMTFRLVSREQPQFAEIAIREDQGSPIKWNYKPALCDVIRNSRMTWREDRVFPLHLPAVVSMGVFRGDAMSLADSPYEIQSSRSGYEIRLSSSLLSEGSYRWMDRHQAHMHLLSQLYMLGQLRSKYSSQPEVKSALSSWYHIGPKDLPRMLDVYARAQGKRPIDVARGYVAELSHLYRRTSEGADEMSSRLVEALFWRALRGGEAWQFLSPEERRLYQQGEELMPIPSTLGVD